MVLMLVVVVAYFTGGFEMMKHMKLMQRRAVRDSALEAW